MKNSLSKGAAPKTGRNLTTTRTGHVPTAGTPNAPKILPPATIIYGAAAGAFFTFSILLLFGAHWLDGFLTFIPGLIFVGFAVHLMKHGQPPRR